jgi:hypothetical protein
MVTKLTAQTLATSRNIDTAQGDLSWNVMVVYLAVTEDNDGTPNITMTCNGSIDEGVTYNYPLQAIEATLGVGTSYNASWLKPTITQNATSRWPWRVDILGFPHVRCSVSSSIADAGDLVSASVNYVIE